LVLDNICDIRTKPILRSDLHQFWDRLHLNMAGDVGVPLFFSSGYGARMNAHDLKDTPGARNGVRHWHCVEKSG
jgi:hypothetical protein